MISTEATKVKTKLVMFSSIAKSDKSADKIFAVCDTLNLMNSQQVMKNSPIG